MHYRSVQSLVGSASLVEPMRGFNGRHELWLTMVGEEQHEGRGVAGCGSVDVLGFGARILHGGHGGAENSEPLGLWCCVESATPVASTTTREQRLVAGTSRRSI
jgi:hypothetical protein